MRFTLLASLVGVLAGLAGGGRVRNLGRASLRAPVLLVAGLAGLLAVAAGPPPHAHAIVVAGTGVLAVFAVANVVRFPGMWLVALGLLANLTVVVLNGGMPYHPEALDAAGIERPATADRLPRSVLHHPAGPGDRLAVLGESIPLAPLHEVLSVGDLAIGVGAASVLTNALVRSRRRDRPRHVRRRQRRARGAPAHAPSATVVVDLTRADAVVDLTGTSFPEGAPTRTQDAPPDHAPPGEEFWSTRAAVLGEDPDADDRREPGELFWRMRDLVEAPAPE